MPHVDWPNLGVIDFKVELYPGLSKLEKETLISAFTTTGVVGHSRISDKWVFIQTQECGFRSATPKQISTLPQLPDVWEAIMLLVN